MPQPELHIPAATPRTAAPTPAITPDSLATDTLQVRRTDRSSEYPFAVYGTADSLRSRPTATAPLSHEVRAEEIFGTAAVAIQPQRFVYAQPQPLTGSPVFQGFVLLLAATYAMLLYHNMNDVRMLLGRISHDTASGERLFDAPGSSGYMRFLNFVTAIGMLFTGVIVVKYGNQILPGTALQGLSHGAALALSLLATAALIAVALVQSLTVRLAGAVTLAQPFTAQLLLLRRTYFSLAVIVTTPTLLFFALCSPGTAEDIWLTFIAIELVVTAILYLREALNLFLSKKISILHWFLYLCAVEIFPISLLWLLAVR